MALVLGKDEKIVREYKFKPSLIFFWLRATFVLTNKRLIGSKPNVVLGFIPLGKEEVNQPLKAIASVESGTSFFFKKFLGGLVLIIAGLVIMTQSADLVVVGLLVALWGLIVFLHSFMSRFSVMNNASKKVGYSLSLLEKSKVSQFVNEINTVITELE